MLLEDAGLRDAQLLHARLTTATLLLQQAVTPRVAVQLLGHSQMSKHCSHVEPELAHEAAVRRGAPCGVWRQEPAEKNDTGTAPSAGE